MEGLHRCGSGSFGGYPFWSIFRHFCHLQTRVEPQRSPGGPTISSQSAPEFPSRARRTLQKWNRSTQHREMALSVGAAFLDPPIASFLELREDIPLMSANNLWYVVRPSGSCLKCQSLQIEEIGTGVRGGAAIDCESITITFRYHSWVSRVKEEAWEQTSVEWQSLGNTRCRES